MTEKKLIAGIDEAGRGCIIGPLVIVGVSIDSGKEKELRKIKVRDSKELSQRQREILAKKIEKIAKDILVIKVGPCKIDTYRKEGVNLNKIEAIKFADVINYLNPNKVYIDGPDINLEKFKKILEKMIKNQTELVIEHYADKKYPIVSAASIIAKVNREEEIEKLKREYGDFGPGYTSNEKTINWLKEWLKTHKNLPEHVVRRSWITAEILEGERKQSKLTLFFKKLIGKE